MADPHCATCTFYDTLSATRAVDLYATVPVAAGILYGVCRRFPPVPSARINREHPEMIDIIGRWPLVPDDLWCGEYREELA